MTLPEGLDTFRQAGADHGAAMKLDGCFAVLDPGHMAFEEIGLADEVGDEALGRPVVDVARRADLQDPARAT